MNYPTKVSLIPSLIAGLVIVAALFFLQRYFLLDASGGNVGRILWGNTISPVIMVIFFTTLFLLWRKRRLLNTEKKLSRHFRAELAPRLFDTSAKLEDVTQNSGRFTTNVLAQRWKLLQQTQAGKGSDDVSATTGFQHADRSRADIEADNLHNSYAIIRFFVWSLPIVGFIGTVWGIGLSISFFSETMSSSQAGASVSTLLQQNIPLVTQGLSTAFDTTLLALVLSVPATGMMVYIEQQERQYLLDMDAEWQRFLQTRPAGFDHLQQLDIVVDEPDGHARALDESIRDLREEAFSRYESHNTKLLGQDGGKA